MCPFESDLDNPVLLCRAFFYNYYWFQPFSMNLCSIFKKIEAYLDASGSFEEHFVFL